MAEFVTAQPIGLDLLRTAVRVSNETRPPRAVVELHGELCPATVPHLRSELEQLVDDGISDIIVELRDLRFCTSHGLDLFDHIHQQLHRRHRGTLRLALDGAPPVVTRIIQIVQANDPTFSPHLTEAPRLGSVAPHERLGDRSV